MPRSLFKRVLFRLHWFAGITAGLVLGVVGFTGGLMGTEDAALALLNPQFHIAAAEREALAPDRWIAAAQVEYPAQSLRSVAWEGADEAVRVRVAREGAHAIDVAIDPYTGTIIGTPRGAAFYETVEQIHRNLAAGPVGKQIVGASVSLLFVFIATGLYMRWPRRSRSPRAWLRMDWRLKGRGFFWHLHAVTGTWVLTFYLISAATGLWWSYDFYRNAVNSIAGVPAQQRRQPPPKNEARVLPSLDRSWLAFREAAPDATRATVSLQPGVDGALEVRYQTAETPHERAWNTLKLDGATGTVVSRELYAEQPRGRRFVSTIFPLHSGSYFGVPGQVLMALAAFLMPLFPLSGLWMWRLRRRNEALRRQHATAASARPLATRTA